MRIFITGATGFIGTHLVRRLQGSSHEVICLARKTSKLDAIRETGAKVIYGDVLDRESLCLGMEGCDRVFHLANQYEMWVQNHDLFRRINVDGTRNVMEMALEQKVGRVVYVSTVAVYGKPKECPFTEESARGPRFFSEYARTKAEADDISWTLHRERGLPLVTLYPGIVLGAGDHKASGKYIIDVINRNVPSTIFHHSSETYIYAEDVVDAILKASELPDVVGKKYLLGGTVMNGKDYARLIGRLANVPLPWLPYPDFVVMAASYLLTWLSYFTKKEPNWGLSIDASRTLLEGFCFDGSKAVRELGIQYTPIEKALEEAIDSYRKEKK